MNDYLAKLQQTPIGWMETAESRYVFHALVSGKELKLRLNDFPDEPLCTIIIDQQETDLDEFPKVWTLPRHRNPKTT